jgi:hypothetical protein
VVADCNSGAMAASLPAERLAGLQAATCSV